MSVVNLKEAEGFYRALQASAKSPKKLRSLDRLWVALTEMIDSGAPLNVVPDVARFLQKHYDGTPALSTITNDTEGMNQLVRLVIQACNQAGFQARKSERRKLTVREKLHESLSEQMTSEKSRALLEEVFRENNQLLKENKILRGAYANLTQLDVFNATLELEKTPSLDLVERKKLKSLFEILDREFEIKLDPVARDLMHPALGYLGAEDAVSVLLNILEH